jgi:hypothetical protein
MKMERRMLYSGGDVFIRSYRACGGIDSCKLLDTNIFFVQRIVPGSAILEPTSGSKLVPASSSLQDICCLLFC